MKYLLWYSVPFVGVHTKAFDRFKDKFLSPPKPDGKAQWFTLDPRFPDVREYLIGIYETRLRDYDLDGFKLDFVDCFGTHEDTKDAFGDGRDYESVPEAADRLMSDIIARLRKIKPDVMIEFRQGVHRPGDAEVRQHLPRRRRTQRRGGQPHVLDAAAGAVAGTRRSTRTW
jgi:alpha-galactosidase